MSIPYVVLEPESPDLPVQVFQPAPGCFLLGRASGNVDICLDDPKVSRRHALLFVEDERVLIHDENSSRGVFIDGTRISPQTSVLISSSNNILIGSYLLYLTDTLEPGVEAQAISPTVFAEATGDQLAAMRKKVVDVSGVTIDGGVDAPAGGISDFLGAAEGDMTGMNLDATISGLESINATIAGVDTVGEGAAAPVGQEVEEKRYTFPPMPPVSADQQDTVDRFIYRRIKPLFDQLVQERTGGSNPQGEDIRDMTEEVLTDILKQQAQHIPAGLSLEDIRTLCVAAFMDYGPLQGLFGDETVTEVMVNSANNLFVEQNGNLSKSHLRFWDDQELRRVIEKMVMVTNRRIDEQQPYQDTRLEDGSRVNIIINPIALSGDSITIRKFPNRRLWVEDLIKYNSLNSAMGEFLQRIVNYKANVIVSGGTGSGKTTLLNILSSFIPDDERLVSIEDAAELRLNQPNKVVLEARPKSLEGGGAVTIRDLVINALRMRPDRIIVGECRGGEALDMLQAMNTGHDGSLTTLHANTPRDAISRLETMCMMAGMDLPAKAIRSQIVSAVNFIVQQSRIADGSRKIVSIQEVLGLEGDSVVMQEVFKFEREGMTPEGKVKGQFVATGVIPQFVSKLRDDRIDFPIDMFQE